MNLEKKTIKETAYKDYALFGWQKSYNLKSDKNDEIVIIRDIKMRHYNEVVVLEKEYFENLAKLRVYKPTPFYIYLILLIAFFIPGVAFAIYKAIKKSWVKSNNKKINNQLTHIKHELQTLK